MTPKPGPLTKERREGIPVFDQYPGEDQAGQYRT